MPRHVNIPSKKILRKTLKNIGFEDIDMLPSHWSLESAAISISCFPKSNCYNANFLARIIGIVGSIISIPFSLLSILLNKTGQNIIIAKK